MRLSSWGRALCCTPPTCRFSRLVTASAELRKPSAPSQRALEEAATTPALLRPPARPPPQQSSAAPAVQRRRSGMAQHSRKLTLAVVGDVHSQWDADSEAALAWLGADVAAFVGDFGEENVQLVERIAAVRQPKAVVLGNHDAWFSLTPSGRRRYARVLAASTRGALQEDLAEGTSTPAIARQLAALGPDHVGFASKRFPALGLTLLGGRPFSKGGRRWSDVAEFYAQQYGVGGHQDSAMRLLDVALSAPEADVKVLVAHNGPTGLGARRFSICGVDWVEPEADHGDPDLKEALDMMAGQGLHVPLVLFGHMHSQLKGHGRRNMVEADPQRGVLYLNAAVVPRVRSFLHPPPPREGDGSGDDAAGAGNGAGSNGNGAEGAAGSIRGHHFLVVELQWGVVTAARDVWVGVQHDAASGSRRCLLLEQEELVKTVLPPELTAAAAAAAVDGGSSSSGGSGRGGGAVAAQQAAEGAAPAATEASGAAAPGSYVCSIYRAHTDEWQPFVLPLPVPARELVDC